MRGRSAWSSHLALGIAILLTGCTTSTDRRAAPSPSPSDESAFLYHCWHGVFDPADVEAPAGLEQGDPALRDLVESLERSHPNTVDGWRVVSDDGERVVAMARRLKGGYMSAAFERTGERLRPDAFAGECEPRVVIGKRSPATWELAEEPAPGDTQVVVRAREIACSSGRKLTQRNTRSHVEYAEETISIAVTAPVSGGTCVDNEAWRLVVDLDEPVRDRALLDAAWYPPEQRYP